MHKHDFDEVLHLLTNWHFEEQSLVFRLDRKIWRAVRFLIEWASRYSAEDDLRRRSLKSNSYHILDDRDWSQVHQGDQCAPSY